MIVTDGESREQLAISNQQSAFSNQLSAFSWFVILSDERKRGPQQAPGLCLLGCWSEESKDPYSCDKSRFVNSRKTIRQQQWSETLLKDRESSPAKRDER